MPTRAVITPHVRVCERVLVAHMLRESNPLAHGWDQAICACRPAVMLAEVGLKYTARKLDLLGGETLQPWFMKLNPTGALPVLEDNGKVGNVNMIIVSTGCPTYRTTYIGMERCMERCMEPHTTLSYKRSLMFRLTKCFFLLSAFPLHECFHVSLLNNPQERYRDCVCHAPCRSHQTRNLTGGGGSARIRLHALTPIFDPSKL
jgi:hypothetical protein